MVPPPPPPRSPCSPVYDVLWCWKTPIRVCDGPGGQAAIIQHQTDTIRENAPAYFKHLSFRESTSFVGLPVCFEGGWSDGGVGRLPYRPTALISNDLQYDVRAAKRTVAIHLKDWSDGGVLHKPKQYIHTDGTHYEKDNGSKTRGIGPRRTRIRIQFNSIQFFISFHTGQYNFNCLSNYLYQ